MQNEGIVLFPGAVPGLLKGGGVHLKSTSKKRGGGPGGGPILGPMLKSLHRGPNKLNCFTLLETPSGQLAIYISNEHCRG